MSWLDYTRKEGECLAWLRGLDKEGYAIVGHEGKQKRVARLVLEEREGPLGNLVTRHTCARKDCINPAHLISGTVAENSVDAVKAGAIKSRITQEIVDEVFRLRLLWVPYAKIAQQVGISSSMVSDLVNFKRKTWMTEKFRK